MSSKFSRPGMSMMSSKPASTFFGRYFAEHKRIPPPAPESLKTVTSISSFAGDSTVLCFRKAEYVVSETQTEAAAEKTVDWLWYPWQANSLRYPAELRTGMEFSVNAASMVDLKCLCVVKDEDGSFATMRKNMSEEMTEAAECGRLLEFSSIPPEDTVVCAWDSQFLQWTRGLILERFCERALVFFFDHGTYGELKLNAIRQMKSAWMKIPRNLICLELEDVPVPAGDGLFSDETIEQAEDMILKFGVTGMVTLSCMNDGKFVGNFRLQDGRSIAEMYRTRGVICDK